LYEATLHVDWSVVKLARETGTAVVVVEEEIDLRTDTEVRRCVAHALYGALAGEG